MNDLGPKPLARDGDPLLDEWVAQARADAVPVHRMGTTIEDAPPNVLSDMLHGRKLDQVKRTAQYEKPWHRAAAYHFAQGMSVSDVALANDKDESTVYDVLRAPWFQANVTTLMADAGKDVMEFLKAEAFNSAITLKILRDDPKVAPSTRKACCDSILDRAYGKPVQKIESNTVLTSSDPVGEERRLREDNDRLRLSLSGASAPVDSSREG